MARHNKDRPDKALAADAKPTVTIAVNNLQISVRRHGFDGYKIAIVTHFMTVRFPAPHPPHRDLEAGCQSETKIQQPQKLMNRYR